MTFKVFDTQHGLKQCEATKFLLDNSSYRIRLTTAENIAYYSALRRDCRTKTPKRVSYKLTGGGWKTAYVDETLTQFFTTTILPLWEQQRLR